MKRITSPFEVKPDILKNYYRVLGAATLILLFLIIAMPVKAQSSFAGRYSGEWVARPTGLAAGEEQHVGTWNISIASDGEVTGVEFDKTDGDKGEIKGFIDEDGFIKVFVKYSTTVTIKGVLEKKGSRLTGTLKQTCSSGSVCASIDITLKRS